MTYLPALVVWGVLLAISVFGYVRSAQSARNLNRSGSQHPEPAGDYALRDRTDTMRADTTRADMTRAI